MCNLSNTLYSQWQWMTNNIQIKHFSIILTVVKLVISLWFIFAASRCRKIQPKFMQTTINLVCFYSINLFSKSFGRLFIACTCQSSRLNDSPIGLLIRANPKPSKQNKWKMSALSEDDQEHLSIAPSSVINTDVN